MNAVIEIQRNIFIEEARDTVTWNKKLLVSVRNHLSHNRDIFSRDAGGTVKLRGFLFFIQS